jgi:hypothetical protein
LKKGEILIHAKGEVQAKASKSFLPFNSLLDHKSMESLHRKHFHKTDKEGVQLAISSWPEGEVIAYRKEEIHFYFHNIINEEGSVNN